ncbi:Dicer-like protein 1 [Entomophthora muscae]|uniref:Dicer-like protein 1 n=1 Tax=Entomophthora muscae TaxID=34485 RepID=A0ACC2RRS1_9FUNG|nr:Dicer-like protein 1 [Entomophthora muscae]
MANAEHLGGLIPRDYQVEVYQRAREGNSLLVLETGAGKTLIAVMLIRDAVEKERNRIAKEASSRKFVVYLVNNVHLAKQQSKVIQDFAPDIPVGLLYSDCGISFGSKEAWQGYAHSIEVLVLTAQIFLNVLRHGLLRITQTSLLIFDECHHARKNHPFNMIMHEFYRHANPRPQIFGMTASPTNSNQALDLAQYELTHNLDSAIIVPTPTEQLEDNTSTPEHRFIEYLPPQHQPTVPALSALLPYCEGFKALERVQVITETILSDLGWWAANWILLELMTEMIHNHKQHLSDATEEELSIQLEAFTVWEEHRPSIVANVEEDITLEPRHVTPKVVTLIGQLTGLLEHHGDKFRGIIFVPMRSIALMLDLLIKKLISGVEGLKPGILLGHGSSKSFHLFQMKHRKQESVIQAFRDGHLNLLIATRVAEEGLDIQPCNVVICLDTIDTIVAYIQSRGRARAKDSTFIVMYDSSKDCRRVHEIIKIEKSLPKMIRNPIQGQCNQHSANDLPEYEVQSTGAKITFNSAVELVMFYCSHLQSDAYTSNQPEWLFDCLESGFRCHLVLPSSCSVRFIDGDIWSSKTRAKQSAAWKGCVDLHRSNAINDNLLPTCEFPDEFGPDLNPSDFHHLGTQQASHCYTSKAPALWELAAKELPTHLFVNHVEHAIPGRRYFAIATRRPLPTLPPIQLISKSFTDNVILQPALFTTAFTAQQILLLAKYAEFVFSASLRKRLTCPADAVVYFFIPFLPNSKDIDWAAIHNTVPSCPHPESLHALEGCIVSHSLDNNRLHLVTKVRSDLNANSPIELNTKGESASLAQYIMARFNRKVKSPQLPVLETTHVPLTTNYLFFQPSVSASSKTKRTLYKPLLLLPENCMLYPIPYDIFLSVLLLPSLLSRVDALLLAAEVKEEFSLWDVCDKQIAEALTLPSASLPLDYERLELLGDAFLKFMVTVYLYVTRPKDDEGKMHCHRVRKICNKTLFQKCRQFNLTQYFNWKPLDKAKWRPPNFINPDALEDHALSEVRLNDKCLADVMEALLGAAVASGGEVAGLRCLMNLGLCFDDAASWEYIRNMYFVPKTPSSPSGLGFDLEAIQKTLGYKFHTPQLLYEALTHPSSRKFGTKNYQRLEFLGDAVLDYLVVRGLTNNFPAMPPGYLSDLKGLLVDNPTLARISVQVDLPRHLVHSSDPLASAIVKFLAHHEDGFANDRALWANSMPKAFSDIIESIIGAVFVDSGLDLKVASKVVRRVSLATYSQIITTASPPISRPNKHLVRYFNQAGCRGLRFIYSSLPEGDPSPGVACELYIHDQLMIVGRGPTETAARNAASSSLLGKINANPRFLERCDCTTMVSCSA